MMKKVLSLLGCAIVAAGLLALCLFCECFTTQFSVGWQLLFYFVIGGTFVASVLGLFAFPKIFKATVVCLMVETLFVALYLALYYSGLLVHFASREALQEWMMSFGVWAWLVFFVIELAQVILIPIPAQVTTLAGIFAFGPWIAFAISSLAVISGSIIAFAIGKNLGVKVLYKIASKETVDKYRKVLSKKGRMLLPIMFLFPMFPDDLLCFVAGTTTMSWSYFIAVTLTTRLIGIGCICAFMGGDIIPFSGWGIPVWIVIAIVLVATSIYLLKNQDKFENYIINKFLKSKKEKLDEAASNSAENVDQGSAEDVDSGSKNIDKKSSKDVDKHSNKGADKSPTKYVGESSNKGADKHSNKDEKTTKTKQVAAGTTKKSKTTKATKNKTKTTENRATITKSKTTKTESTTKTTKSSKKR